MKKYKKEQQLKNFTRIINRNEHLEEQHGNIKDILPKNGNQENAYLNPINIFNLSFFIYQLKMLKLNVKLQKDKKYVIVGIMKQRYL